MPGVRFTNTKTLLYYLLTGTLMMKNLTSRENCDSRVWWISAQDFYMLLYTHYHYPHERKCRNFTAPKMNARYKKRDKGTRAKKSQLWVVFDYASFTNCNKFVEFIPNRLPYKLKWICLICHKQVRKRQSSMQQVQEPTGQHFAVRSKQSLFATSQRWELF